MSISQVIFYLLSAAIIAMAVLAVTTRKIFRSAIWLLFTLLGIAGVYFWLEVEFIAAVQIMVYAGGIAVLIIFSVFLTQQAGTEMARPSIIRIIASLLSVLFGFGFSFSLIYNHGFITGPGNLDMELATIGRQMLGLGQNGYALPFELVSILLLAAMIGCIVIALKSPAHIAKPEPKILLKNTEKLVEI